ALYEISEMGLQVVAFHSGLAVYAPRTDSPRAITDSARRKNFRLTFHPGHVRLNAKVSGPEVGRLHVLVESERSVCELMFRSHQISLNAHIHACCRSSIRRSTHRRCHAR